MTRAQLNKLTGTRAVPDLWHFAPGGTLGANRGPGLFDELAAPVPACEICGNSTEGMLHCDDCISKGLANLVG